MNPALFSTGNAEWTTPRWLFDRLDAEFGFTLDAAASAENALCPAYLTEADDALQQAWTGVCFCNPPYGHGVGRWVRHGWEQVYEDRVADVVVFLVASRTGTQWWHRYAMRSTEIRFVEGRLRFGEAQNAAPFDSAVLVFDRHKRHPVAISSLPQPKGDR